MSAGIGGHVRGLHLALGRGDVLDPLLGQVGLGGALADREGLGPLQAALLGDDGADLGAVLLEVPVIQSPMPAIASIWPFCSEEKVPP